ncbi:NAD dependent epimerase/dehydratase family protein [Corynebacterium occultum]|uniref:NAD dependent epimerase/dehydratase family protein n=1 Tax=Corynebacterium occultum TaxID=2675219 RepID=A0A6B8VVY9_9CORY|nr:SDR family oxidoreductase [Corynebacterium occultum]QGU08313.1 NAD dependent epimerase/dehydratase family protein [Corynebacterium occultum]
MPANIGLTLTDLPTGTGTVLVAGDGGLIGSYAAQAYHDLGWEVHGVSRRELEHSPWTHHSIDLLDPEAATAGLAELKNVTHLVFGAYIEKPTDAELIETNDALLRNTLDALHAAGAPLKHVTFYQGGKAYGHHLGFFNTPAKESDPRLIAPHFYYTQEDLVRELSEERGFSFTALRPEGVTGYATGNPMNLLLVIGVYAAISKELGLPMRFPGTRAAYEVLYQTTDAELLARATIWAGATEAAADQVFNITNGDQFRWSQLWPRFAQHFGMDYAAPQQMSLSEAMPTRAAVWEELVEKYDLVATDFNTLVAWPVGDFLFHHEADNITSTIKARQAGFADALDTESRLPELFDDLIAKKILPPTLRAGA